MIRSYERKTGMDALHQTELWWPGRDGAEAGWYPVSAFPKAVLEGRDHGFEVWSIETSLEYRAYHRSNSGTVRVYPGEESLGYR